MIDRNEIHMFKIAAEAILSTEKTTAVYEKDTRNRKSE